MMRRPVWIAISIMFLIAFYMLGKKPDQPESRLFPALDPVETDYFSVSGDQSLYFERYGSPDGIPVFLLPESPGSAVSSRLIRFFNPDSFLLVLHDARGVGRSRPPGTLDGNTLQSRMNDIDSLRRHLNLDRILLFGGGWGSALALAYAQAFPDHVSGMVLYGVFTATAREIDYLCHGGIRLFFPDEYQNLIDAFPVRNKQNLPRLFLERMMHDDDFIRRKYTRIWINYIRRLSGQEAPEKSAFTESDSLMQAMETRTLLDHYFLANGCFLDDGQLLRLASRLKEIPVFLVNGRYDMLYPPKTAHALHRLLPKSQLMLVDGAGHDVFASTMEAVLMDAILYFQGGDR